MRCLVTGGAGFIGFSPLPGAFAARHRGDGAGRPFKRIRPGLKRREPVGPCGGRRGKLCARQRRGSCRLLPGACGRAGGLSPGGACGGTGILFAARTHSRGQRPPARPALLSAMGQKGVRRCVLASSSTVYGDAAPPFREDAPLGRAQSPYAQSKQTAEMLSAAHCASFPCAVAAAGCFRSTGRACARRWRCANLPCSS